MNTTPVIYAVSLKNNNDADSGLAYGTVEAQEADGSRQRGIKIVNRAGVEFFVDADAVLQFAEAVKQVSKEFYTPAITAMKYR